MEFVLWLFFCVKPRSFYCFYQNLRPANLILKESMWLSRIGGVYEQESITAGPIVSSFCDLRDPSDLISIN